MNILVVGSGAREHVLAWKLAQSSKVTKVFCAPGNGGMESCSECINIDIEDYSAILAFAKKEMIDLIVVGPEAPLVGGLVDVLEAEGFKVFGPSKAAAQLEGSKAFAKDVMARYGVPTAAYETFTDIAFAKSYLDKASFPLVVKADGLAAGKGVIICEEKSEAVSALDEIMTNKVFQDAGNRVVIEDFLRGEEASILAISDGENIVLLDSSQDHKRAFDNDEGPNTGGMGAYSPAPVVRDDLWPVIMEKVVRPVVDGMKKDGHPFKGVLYAGLMVNEEGVKVLEFNVRFGDPEAQAVLVRLKTDLVDVMLASIDGTLDQVILEWDERVSVCVVLASGGYPGSYENGKAISGLDDVSKEAVVFHAGTKKEGHKVVTSGGRVLSVTAFGIDIADAIRNVYKEVPKISFDGGFYRKDIGKKALCR